MKICIDPGHGGADPGAIGIAPATAREPAITLKERDFTLDVALLLEEELARCGHSVLLTRRRDRSLKLNARAAHANRHAADLFISIHANAAANPAAEGIEVFHFPGSTAGKSLADRIMRRLAAAFPGHVNRGVKPANFAVLRLTAMPAVLVECEFLTNPDRLRRFLSCPGKRREIAVAIAAGVATCPDAPPAVEAAVEAAEEPAPAKTHTVQAGDTLSALARRFGLTVDTIANDNDLSNPNLIRVGQALRIRSA